MADGGMSPSTPCTSRQRMSPSSLFTPLKQGKAIGSETRKNVLNVYARLRQENPEDSVRQVVKKVSVLTGVSGRTVFRIKKQKKESSPLSTPGKKRPAAAGKRSRLNKYDDFTLSCVRRKFHSFFRRNEIPTLDKVLKEVNDDEEIFSPNISRTTLYRILKDMGFSFQKRKRESMLLERKDIILWRRNYLRKIRELKEKKASIYYLDETWVNEGHSQNRVWQDNQIKDSYQATSRNLTVGLTAPKGKGRRLIITHIGNEEGFVPDAEDIFVGKKSGDYHEEMDGPHFENWFKSIMPRLKPNSVIVMDNAPYHSVKKEKTPTASWKKSAIQEWLSHKNITWTVDMIKLELLNKVSAIKHLYDGYKVEAIAEEFGHTILRLPPYHCELNPIELIWSQVKGHVARENRTFKLAEVRGLVKEGIDKVSAENWTNCIKHVTEREKEMWDLDGLVDEVWDRQEVIISFDCESTDTASDSEEECP